MKFYGLKTCDTCRKALKALKVQGIDVEVIDVRADGVREDDLRRWVRRIDWKKLLNTRSTTWRKLAETDKTDMNADKAVALMLAHPTLIKRPVIEKDGQVSVGWPSPLV
ncbi:MAG TPA: Spx/MgsR family RNA polymerase-binding regulatory protein [Hellea balneolensis]|uniref:Spx/MgsR family RNA polymerase-binding regulatory protein n=1 Tax=Hellea balneolensis TaxID=287478 RepID=A0A7V5NWE0_9PROT|nr:Spx/MgsR family RNA polymerase-binding regulatory protein [Hellea balneolensis]